jgi:hypothetical protein
LAVHAALNGETLSDANHSFVIKVAGDARKRARDAMLRAGELEGEALNPGRVEQVRRRVRDEHAPFPTEYPEGQKTVVDHYEVLLTHYGDLFPGDAATAQRLAFLALVDGASSTGQVDAKVALDALEHLCPEDNPRRLEMGDVENILKYCQLIVSPPVPLDEAQKVLVEESVDFVLMQVTKLQVTKLKGQSAQDVAADPTVAKRWKLVLDTVGGDQEAYGLARDRIREAFTGDEKYADDLIEALSKKPLVSPIISWGVRITVVLAGLAALLAGPAGVSNIGGAVLMVWAAHEGAHLLTAKLAGGKAEIVSWSPASWFWNGIRVRTSGLGKWGAVLTALAGPFTSLVLWAALSSGIFGVDANDLFGNVGAFMFGAASLLAVAPLGRDADLLRAVRIARGNDWSNALALGRRRVLDQKVAVAPTKNGDVEALLNSVLPVRTMSETMDAERLRKANIQDALRGDKTLAEYVEALSKSDKPVSLVTLNGERDLTNLVTRALVDKDPVALKGLVATLVSDGSVNALSLLAYARRAVDARAGRPLDAKAVNAEFTEAAALGRALAAGRNAGLPGSGLPEVFHLTENDRLHPGDSAVLEIMAPKVISWLQMEPEAQGRTPLVLLKRGVADQGVADELRAQVVEELVRRGVTNAASARFIVPLGIPTNRVFTSESVLSLLRGLLARPVDNMRAYTESLEEWKDAWQQGLIPVGKALQAIENRLRTFAMTESNA